MTYSKTSNQSWITQDSTNDRIFMISVNEDPSLTGEHTLSVLVTSDDYPTDITAKTIEVPISVRCTNP